MNDSHIFFRTRQLYVFKILEIKRKELEMKTIVFSLAFLSIVLFSCKDNSINDPVSPNQVNKSGEGIINPFNGIIPLDTQIMVTGSGGRYYDIKGKIDYNGEFTGLFSNQVNNVSDVKLEILINALLTKDDINTQDQNKWIISSESQDRFYVNPEGKKVIEKSYPARRGNNLMWLVCTFDVSRDNLSLDSVTLKNLTGWYGPNNP